MANINLSSFSDETKKREAVPRNALLGIGLILILILAAWASLILYKKYYLEKNISETENSYQGYIDQLKSEESRKAIDFQKRLDVSGTFVGQGRNINIDLSQIEDLIVPNVYLASYSYDNATKNISLNCIGDNFNTVAKQILSFKKSDFFSNVIAGATSVDSQSNKIVFPVVLTIK
jgi:hypothetical protein